MVSACARPGNDLAYVRVAICSRLTCRCRPQEQLRSMQQLLKGMPPLRSQPEQAKHAESRQGWSSARQWDVAASLSQSKPTGAPTEVLKSSHSIHERGYPVPARVSWNCLQHEAPWQVLGQRRDGKIFSTFKSERLSKKHHRTRNGLRADVFDYLERLYNPRGRHSTIGYISPVQFEEFGMRLTESSVSRGRPCRRYKPMKFFSSAFRIEIIFSGVSNKSSAVIA